MMDNKILAVAALLSAVSAFFSWRAARRQNKLTEQSIQPVLRGRYLGTKEIGIMIKNYGKGPVLNLDLTSTTMHYTDIKNMYEFRMDKNDVRSIMPAEERLFRIALVPLDKAARVFDANYAAYQYVNELSAERYSEVIFENIFGKKFICKLKPRDVGNETVLDFIDIKAYNLKERLDEKWKHYSFRFKPLRSRRERLSIHKDT